MAQTLEKNFLQKIRDMPAEEVEVQQPLKSKGKKPRGPKGAGTAATATRKRTLDAQPIQPVHTVTSSNDEVALPPTDYTAETEATTTNGQNTVASTAATVASTSPVVQISNSHMQVIIFLLMSRKRSKC